MHSSFRPINSELRRVHVEGNDSSRPYPWYLDCWWWSRWRCRSRCCRRCYVAGRCLRYRRRSIRAAGTLPYHVTRRRHRSDGRRRRCAPNRVRIHCRCSSPCLTPLTAVSKIKNELTSLILAFRQGLFDPFLFFFKFFLFMTTPRIQHFQN